MPDDLDGITACISPGVSSECGFDEEIANLGIDVLMADASVAGPPKQHPRFHFFRKFVDITATPNAMTMADLASKTPAGDLLLQMDIEGAEYRVLAGMSDDLLQRFRIMVIEFHDLDQMFQRFAFDIMKPVFEKLTRHHHVIHAHPNNCAAPVNRSSLSVPPVMEFTFYRKDRVQGPLEQPMSYPHALDACCVQDRPPVALPACWR